MLIRKMKLVSLFIITLILITVLLSGCTKDSKNEVGSTQQEKKQFEPITLKLAHVVATSHPYHIGAEKFKQLVEEKTNGKVKIEIYPGAQLGDEKTSQEGVAAGTIDMALVSSSLNLLEPKFMVFDMPFLFKNREHAYKVLDGPFGSEMMKLLEEKGVKGLAFWENGFRQFTNNIRPIKTPEDFNGVKMSTTQNKMRIAAFKAWGVNVTPMSYGDQYMALKTKIVDGQECTIPVVYSTAFYEVQKYLSLSNYVYSAAYLLINKKTWDGFPEEIQKALQQAAYEARDYERQVSREQDEELLVKLQEKGMEVNEVDVESFEKASKPLYEEFKPQFGDLIEKIKNVN